MGAAESMQLPWQPTTCHNGVSSVFRCFTNIVHCNTIYTSGKEMLCHMHKTIMGGPSRGTPTLLVVPSQHFVPYPWFRYGKEALRNMYKTIMGRQGTEEGVTPEFMAEELQERGLGAGTPQWKAARYDMFKVARHRASPWADSSLGHVRCHGFIQQLTTV